MQVPGKTVHKLNHKLFRNRRAQKEIESLETGLVVGIKKLVILIDVCSIAVKSRRSIGSLHSVHRNSDGFEVYQTNAFYCSEKVWLI